MPETKTTTLTQKVQGKDAATEFENALCTNAEGHNFAACSNFALQRDTRLYTICIDAVLCVSPLWLQYGRFQN